MGQEVGSDAIYMFGPFRLDARRQILRKEGETGRLTGKPVKVLLALVERAGELVTSEDLMKKVWGDTAVEPNNLDQQISVLRKVFGEGPKDNGHIMTVPREGYKFVAPVEIVRTASVRPSAIRPARENSVDALVEEANAAGSDEENEVLTAEADEDFERVETVDGTDEETEMLIEEGLLNEKDLEPDD